MCQAGVRGSAPVTLLDMAVATRSIAESCIAAKRAARTLASVPTAAKDAALAATARLLDERTEAILKANAADLADEPPPGSPPRCATG